MHKIEILRSYHPTIIFVAKINSLCCFTYQFFVISLKKNILNKKCGKCLYKCKLSYPIR